MRLFQALALLIGVALAFIFALSRGLHTKIMRFAMAFCLIITLSLSPILAAHADSIAGKVLATPAIKSLASPAYQNTVATPTIAATQTSPTTQVAIVENCSPDTTYSLPSPISPTETGLDTVIDQPSTYTVYGDSTTQITDQIAECTPVDSTGTDGTPGKYAASTANAVSWDVSYNVTNDVCSIASVDVSIHINQVFPHWQTPTNATASLIDDWAAYIAKLHAYEQGHVNLDEIYAQKVVTDLNAISPESCDTIEQTVNSVASADMQASLAANSNYDQTNGFGNKEDVNL